MERRREAARFGAERGARVVAVVNVPTARDQQRPVLYTAAQPLRFLDFLIYQPIRAVLLYGAGVTVNVAAPERYAIHKLIVADRRRADNNGTAKSRKDLAQATSIIETMIEQRQKEDLADAFMEAYDRGPAWKEAIRKSIGQIEDGARQRIQSAFADGITKLGRNPAEYDLSDVTAVPKA